VDAAEAIDQRLFELPGRFSFRWTRWNAVAVSVAVAALFSSIAVPNNVELARVERSAVARAVQDQLAQVVALRAEIADNPHLSSSLKATMLTELDTLQQKLQSSNLDQAAGIAVLADAEQKLRTLLQTPSADFDGLVAAAQLVWTSAAQNSEWEPEQALSTTDLGRASEASLFLSDNVGGMNNNEERRVSFSLERASDQASGRDPALSKLLAQASEGVRTRDHPPATRALVEASQKFAEANNQREDAVALENVLAQLNKGREQVAQAGRPQTKKAQVGFRRRGSAAGNSTPTPDLEDFAPTADAQQPGQAGGKSGSNTSGLGPVVGQSNVASYGASQSSRNQGGQPAKTGGQGGDGPPGSGPGGGSTGQDSGQAGGNQQSAGGGSAGGASTDSGEQGTLGGSINGPVGGAGGAISQVPNPAGQGNAQPARDKATGGTGDGAAEDGNEQVYVPETGGSDGQGGSAETEKGGSEDVSTEGVEGRPGEGEGNGAQLSSGSGEGGAVRVQTPYREVIAEYARQATEAIDRAYVPSDAKEYVREYFSELRK
jgi:hypothetical protein